MTDRIVHLGRGAAHVVSDDMPSTEFVDRAPRRHKLTWTARAAQQRAQREMDAELCRASLVGTPKRAYGRTPLIDRARDQCAYMVSRTDCCGERTVPGESWCPKHYAEVTGMDDPETLEAAE